MMLHRCYFCCCGVADLLQLLLRCCCLLCYTVATSFVVDALRSSTAAAVSAAVERGIRERRKNQGEEEVGKVILLQSFIIHFIVLQGVKRGERDLGQR